MRPIIELSLKLRFAIVVVAIVLLTFGVVQLRAMPVDVLPEFTPAYVEVQTEALGLSAVEVEQLITLGMEQDWPFNRSRVCLVVQTFPVTVVGLLYQSFDL